MNLPSILITLLACILTTTAYPPMPSPSAVPHTCTDIATPSHYNISTLHYNISVPMRLNTTWPTRNHPATCTCALYTPPHLNSTSPDSNVTAQMSYGQTDPVYPGHVDPLVAVGIVIAIVVVLVLGTAGCVWVKRRVAGGKGKGEVKGNWAGMAV